MAYLQMTAAFCREQEVMQRANAASEPLENRKKIALAAAKAWEQKAVMLEKHDAGDTPLDRLDAEITLEFAREAEFGAEEDAESEPPLT